MSAVAERNVLVPQERVEKSARAVIGLDPTPADLLRTAVQNGASIEQMRQLMELQERWEANQARKAYNAAMAAFKANPPTIIKDHHVSFTTDRGTTEYDHATLHSVCVALIAGLSEHGISHRWVPDQTGGKVKVTCVLTHVAGHSESVSLESEPDKSGGKNSIQAIGSAVTYLQRYTLLSATGLATKGQDDDAVRADLVGPGQLAAIEEAIKSSGLKREALLEYLCITDPSQILADNYQAVMDRIEEKRKRVDAGSQALAMAQRMRDVMALDLSEFAIAETVRDLNTELNKDQRTFESAWTLLSSQERTSWTGWKNWKEKVSGNRY